MSIQNLETRFLQALPTDQIDILLEAVELGYTGIALACTALSAPSRTVRQSAQTLLQEIDSPAAKEAIWNYLPFPKMQCLHTIGNLLPEKYYQDLGPNPKYVAISNYKHFLFCYWNNGDNRAYVTHCALSTGKKVSSYSLDNSHALSLGSNGRTGISNDYYPRRLDVETQEFCLFDPETFPQTNLPNSSVAACPSQLPLAAFWEHIGPRVEIELWDYEQSQQRFRYVNTETYQSAYNFTPDSRSQEVCFSPDGSLLIAKLYFSHESRAANLETPATCSLKIWDTHSADLVCDKTSNFRPMSGCAQHPETGFLLYGLLEKQITIQGLLNDKILFQQPGHTPCHMTLDGRIIAFCTGNSEVEVWDWKQNHKLANLKHPPKPLLNIEISQDREFIITHSQDGSIKVWGIPEGNTASESSLSI